MGDDRGRRIRDTTILRAVMTLHDIRPTRRFYWAWGREWSCRGVPNRFGLIFLGIITVHKDTDEPWHRGWGWYWNKD
jgi:hypothetical protein